jgi:hypothetical protein
MKKLTLLSCLGLLSGILSAQEFSKFTFDVGAGFTTPVGGTGRYLDTGWNVRGGAGVNFNHWLGVNLNAGYDSMGINTATLTNIGVPGGTVSAFSLTLDPVVHLTPHLPVDVYVTGGGGYFRQEQTFTQPGQAIVGGYYPFFGFYPVSYNQVIGQYSVNKPGIDAGLGVNFKTWGHSKVFAEARYDRIFLSNGYHTDYVPVTFGFRW